MASCLALPPLCFIKDFFRGSGIRMCHCNPESLTGKDRLSKIVCLIRNPGEAAAEAHDGPTMSSHQAAVEKFLPLHLQTGGTKSSGINQRVSSGSARPNFPLTLKVQMLWRLETCWNLLKKILYTVYNAIYFLWCEQGLQDKGPLFSVQVRPSSLSKKQRRGMWPNEGQQKIAHVSSFTELSWRQRRRLKAGKEWQKWWIQMN